MSYLTTVTFVTLVVTTLLTLTHVSVGYPTAEYTHPVVVPDEYRLHEKLMTSRNDASFLKQFTVITLAVKLQNTQKLEELIYTVSDPSSPHYGKYWTLDQIDSLVAPAEKSVSKVHEWLESNNALSGCTMSKNSGFLTCRLSLSVAQKMLSTQFYPFTHEPTGKTVFRAVKPYTIPYDVAEHLDFISGVHSFPRFGMQPAFAKAQASTIKTTPQVIRSKYGVDDLVGLNPENLQCVVSFLGQYYSPSDLSLFFKTFNLTDQPVEKVIGPNNPVLTGVEAELDIQYLMGIAQDVRTWIWSTGGLHDGQEPFLDWLIDVSNTATIPYVFSISYQDYENTVDPAYMKRVNVEFMKVGSRGTTLVTGSGDWGTGCLSTCQRFQADFPSSSPFIVSTGATEFVDSVDHERGVTFSSGGFSEVFARPAYQNEVVEKYLSHNSSVVPPYSFFNQSGRGFPDVSAIGVNFQVFVNGSVMNVGGTSAATPTFASMVSLMNDLRISKGLPTMGWINPFLYSAAKISTKAFTDIVEGSNPYGCCKRGFDCVDGWDPMTGLGTPNFDVLSKLALDPHMFTSFPRN